ADARRRGPLGAVGGQVADRRGEVVVGVHQPGIRGDDAVAVGVGVVAGGDVEAVALPDEGRHGVRGGAVHPDLPVPVQRHEAPGGVGQRIDDRQVEAVLLGDPAPVGHRRAAERVGPDPDSGRADRVQVQHLGQVGHVAAEEVVAAGAVGGEGARVRDAADVLEAAPDDVVGAVLDPGRGVGAGGAAAGRVVLESAVGGRVVGGRDDDAVRAGTGRVPPVVGEDGV